tara:strand:+ start:2575 stop:3153 length:579 start_codon:yes stop_codon:yes gene_type:complete
MSVRESVKELSRMLAATDSDLSFPIVYRQFRTKGVDPAKGTVTDNYNDIFIRCYQDEITRKEASAAGGVVRRGDVIFHITEDKLTPRSEEDEVYKSIERLGTVSLDNGATQVTGSSVAWSNILPGDRIRFADQSTFHRVASVLNASSQLSLAAAYSQATLSSATYHIYRSYQVIGWEMGAPMGEWEVQGRRI